MDQPENYTLLHAGEQVVPATPVWKTIGESTLDVNYIEKIDGYRIPVRRHQSYLDTQYELEDQATQHKIRRAK